MPTVASFDVRIGAHVNDFERKIRRLQDQLRGLRESTDRSFIRPTRDSLRTLDREIDGFSKKVRSFQRDIEKSFGKDTFKVKIKAELDQNSINTIRRQLAHAIGVPITPNGAGGFYGGVGQGGGRSGGGLSMRTKLIIGAVGAGTYGAAKLAGAVVPPLINYGGPAAAAVYSAPVLHRVTMGAWREGRLGQSRELIGLNRRIARGSIFTSADTAEAMRELMDVGIESPSALRRHMSMVTRYAQAQEMELPEAAKAYADLVEKHGAASAYRSFKSGTWGGAPDTLYSMFRRVAFGQGTSLLDAITQSGEPFMMSVLRDLNERMGRTNSLFDMKLMDPRTANKLDGQARRDFQTLKGESWFMTALRGMLGTESDPMARKNGLIRFLESDDKSGMIAKYLGDALEKVKWGDVAESMAEGIGDSDIWKDLGKYIPWEDVGYSIGVGMPQMISGIMEGLMKGGWNMGQTYAKEQLGLGPIGQTAFGMAGAGLMGYLGYRRFVKPIVGGAVSGLEKIPGVRRFITDPIKSKSHDITVNVKTKGKEALQKLWDSIKKIPKRKTSTVSARATGEKGLRGLFNRIRSIPKSKTTKVGANTKSASTSIGNLVKKLKGLNKGWKAGKINTSTKPADGKIKGLRDKLKKLNKTWKAGKIDINPKKAFDKIKSLVNVLGKLKKTWSAGSVDIDTSPALKKIRSLWGSLGRLRKRHGGGTVSGGDLLGNISIYGMPIDFGSGGTYRDAKDLERNVDPISKWFDDTVNSIIRHRGGSVPKAHSGKSFNPSVVQGAGTIPVNLWGGEMVLTQQQQSWLFNLLRGRREAGTEQNQAMVAVLRSILKELKQQKGSGDTHYHYSPSLPPAQQEYHRSLFEQFRGMEMMLGRV
jgi:DNA uptake protein ComE-like DNA-binding protein